MYLYITAELDTLTWRDPCRFPGSPSAPRKWTARYHIWNTGLSYQEDDDGGGHDGHHGDVGHDDDVFHDDDVDHDDYYLVRVPPLPEPRLASL